MYSARNIECNNPNPDNSIGINRYEYLFDLAIVTVLIEKNNTAHILCSKT